MLGDFMKAMGAIAQGRAPTIARTAVNGLVVSTVQTYDCGPETAIIDVNGTHPVECS